MYKHVDIGRKQSQHLWSDGGEIMDFGKEQKKLELWWEFEKIGIEIKW